MRRSISARMLIMFALIMLACGGLVSPTEAPVIIATFANPGQVQAPGPAAQPIVPAASAAVAAPPLQPGWTTVICTPAQVRLGVPPGFTTEESVETGQLWIQSESTGVYLEFMCVPAEHGGDFRSEMAWYRDFQKNVQWGPWTQDSTAIGPMGWAEGPNPAGDPIFGAVIGPTRSGHILTLWGMAPQAGWESAKDTFLQVLHSIQYAS